jgi:hypothetical protein
MASNDLLAPILTRLQDEASALPRDRAYSLWRLFHTN